MSQAPAFWDRHAPLVFASKTFAAAMLAYSIALSLDMPRPFWAMTTVYITANQLTGAAISKAVYRVLGTLAGAVGTVLLIPNLVSAPELLSLAIALWIGVCVYLSLIDGTPRGYAFMLAGYTIPLLGFPIVSTPELTFDLVVSRVQEIVLGIICASLVPMLVLPRTVASAIAKQTDAWLDGARRLGADSLTGFGSEHERDLQRMRLAAAASEIATLSQHLGYESATSSHISRGLELLRQHMLSLLPLLASIEGLSLALNSPGGTWVVAVEVCAKIARWLREGGQNVQQADALRSVLREATPELDARTGWTDILLAGLMSRLRNLVDITQDFHVLRQAIADGRDPGRLPLAFTADAPSAAAAHRDHGLALWSAAAATLSVLASCAFWILTGWEDGGGAALFAAVVGTLYAGLDEPAPAFRALFKLILIVIAVTGIYTFGVLPRVTTIEVLIVALMPTFVLFGWMAARPATAQAGYLLGLFTSVQLALQPSYSADFASFANSSIALLIGIAITSVTFGIVRWFGAAWIAERLVRSNWQTLAAVADSRTPHNRGAISSLIQHRLALLAARIGAAPADARSDGANLRQLRTALNVIDLRQASIGLSQPAVSAIETLLARLASAFRAPAAGRNVGLAEQLDSTIALTLQELAGDARNQALIGLAGIRSGLFPDAPPYQPHEAEPSRRAA